MAVYRRQQSSDPFRNYGPYGAAPGLARMLEIQCAENERIARELREREGVVDLVCIDGLWQEPPK